MQDFITETNLYLISHKLPNEIIGLHARVATVSGVVSVREEL